MSPWCAVSYHKVCMNKLVNILCETCWLYYLKCRSIFLLCCAVRDPVCRHSLPLVLHWKTHTHTAMTRGNWSLLTFQSQFDPIVWLHLNLDLFFIIACFIFNIFDKISRSALSFLLTCNCFIDKPGTNTRANSIYVFIKASFRAI